MQSKICKEEYYKAEIRSIKNKLSSNCKDLDFEIGLCLFEIKSDFKVLWKIPLKVHQIFNEYKKENDETVIDNYTLDELIQERNRLKDILDVDVCDMRYVVGKNMREIIQHPYKIFTAPYNIIKNYICNKKMIGLGKIEYVSNTVLFVATNGAGLGHLTRCLAVARQIKKIDKSVNIIFLTTSLALPIVNREGFLTYCVPSKMLIDGISERQWNILLRNQLKQLFKLYDFKVMVFDGAIPYAPICTSCANKNIKKIWIKRGGIKSKTIEDSRREYEKYFDLIITPAEAFQGIPENQGNHFVVNPIMYLEKEEMWDRDDVRRYLKLPQDKLVIYIQLGAGNINDINSDLGLIINELDKRDNVCIVVGESIIGNEIRTIRDNVYVIKDYPNSKYYKGFDIAISAVGYNSFHEMVYCGIPTIYIPNMHTKADNQYERAMIAEKNGLGKVITDLSVEKFNEVLDNTIDLYVKNRKEIVNEYIQNGAVEAANIVLDTLKKCD